MLSVNQLNGFGGAGTQIDQYWDNVVLLMNMDGANGGTTFNEIASLKTVTLIGSPTTDTSIKKQGSASAKFNGTGDALSLADSPDWNLSADFTIEAWVYLNALIDSTQAIVAQQPPGVGLTTQYAWQVRVDSLNRLSCLLYNSTPASFSLAASGNFPIGQWVHVAFVRSGNTISQYINGSLDGSAAFSGTTNNSTQVLTIGATTTTTGFWGGYIDELRITKGVARYTANFTPPSEPFPGF